MQFDMVLFGKRIQELRKKRDQSQVQVAMALNISTQYLSNMETGERNPSIDLLVQMANHFHVSLEYLILGISTPLDAQLQMRDELAHVVKHLSRVYRLMYKFRNR